MKIVSSGLSFILGVLLLSSVSSSQSQDQKKTYQRTGEEASITGTVAFIGDPPKPHEIDMYADPACVRMNKHPVLDDLIITNGFVANVLIYIKKGSALDEFTFETPATPVVLDQRGCRFVPRVLGLQTNQILEIRNSDPTIHNVHPIPKKNPEWNQSQPPGGEPLLTKFTVPEVPIPIKNNQHPWMKTYAAVFAHPFFSVTDHQGAFAINGLPPGTYTLVVWHERFGEKTRVITVTPGANQYLQISFDLLDYKEWN